jgi:hypothetical protein
MHDKAGRIRTDQNKAAAGARVPHFSGSAARPHQVAPCVHPNWAYASYMTWGLELTAAEFAALKAVDGTMKQREMTPEIEARLLQLELIERTESGVLCQTAYGALRVLTAQY